MNDLQIRNAWADGFNEGAKFRRIALLGAFGAGLGAGMVAIILLFAHASL